MMDRLRQFALLSSLCLAAFACGSDNEDRAASGEGSTATGETVAGAGNRSDWPGKLVFGAVPSEESSALEQSYKPIIAVLEAQLGLDIEFTQATDYAGIIEGQIAGKVDLAQYGPFSYAIAVANGADIRPVGAMIDEKGAEPGYVSYGITKGDNDAVQSIEDFAGKTVCFVDPASTSGFLYPSAGLIKAGIDPDEDVQPTFAGGHDASVLSVVKGDCEVGFAYDAMVDTLLVKDGAIEEGAVKTVWKSEVIAGSPLAVRTSLPESLVAEIDRIVIELANKDHLEANGFCDGGCKLTDEDVWGYAPVDDAFYDGVREVCRATKAESCEGLG